MAKKKKKHKLDKVAKRDLPEDSLAVKKESKAFYIILAIATVVTVPSIKFGFNTTAPTSVVENDAPEQTKKKEESSIPKIKKLISTNFEERLQEYPPAVQKYLRAWLDPKVIGELEESFSLEDAAYLVSKQITPDFTREQLSSWLEKSRKEIENIRWDGSLFYELTDKDKLHAIGTYLTQNKGFVYGDEKAMDSFSIKDVIEDKRGTCASLPIVYTLLANRFNLPVYLVTVSRHVFARYDDGETKINIESTSPYAMGVGTKDSFYLNAPKEEPQVTEKILNNTTALKTLSLRGAISVMLANNFAYSRKNGDRRKAHESLAAQFYFNSRSELAISNILTMYGNTMSVNDKNSRRFLEYFSELGEETGVVGSWLKSTKGLNKKITSLTQQVQEIEMLVNDLKHIQYMPNFNNRPSIPRPKSTVKESTQERNKRLLEQSMQQQKMNALRANRRTTAEHNIFLQVERNKKAIKEFLEENEDFLSKDMLGQIKRLERINNQAIKYVKGSYHVK